MDVVELAPLEGAPSSDFVAAKLVFKCLAYRMLQAARWKSMNCGWCYTGRPHAS